MIGKYYQEFLKLENNPLNQEAKRLLKKAGVEVDPSYLAVFQLMEWGLQQGIRIRGDDPDYLDFLERLTYEEDTAGALDYLTRDRDGTLQLEEGDLKRFEDPEAAAEFLLEELWARIKADPLLYRMLP